MQALHKILNSDNKTLLCVGPLSTNIIDATIDFSHKKNIPIVLVASRRQIDSQELGSGYVNNWSTEEFVKYVRPQKSENIFIERDHGGPWQGSYEVGKNLNVDESLAASKRSFEADIDAGVQIIHIDPTVPIGNETLSFDNVLSRLYELYAHVAEYAIKQNKNIEIEIGTEEQSGGYTNLDQLDEFLEKTNHFCSANKVKAPLFVVVQTGAKVMENKNIGAFEVESELKKNELKKNIQNSASIAAKYGIYIKEHNADYLSVENLLLRPKIGIRAANIAPELGYLETKGLVDLLKNYGNTADYEKFMQIVFESGKWKKWLRPQSDASTLDKVLIAGHYCYSDPRVIEIKKRLEKDLLKKNIQLNDYLKKSIYEIFNKYTKAFGF